MTQKQPRPGLEAAGFLGRRDRPFVVALAAAGRRALANSPKRCIASTKAPPHAQCQRVAVTGSRLCEKHIGLAEFVRVDVERRRRFECIAETSTWAAQREEARLALRAIERRRLRYTWAYIDPYFKGATVAFANQRDEARCIEWLRQKGFDPYGYSPVTDEPVSACARDRSLWAAMKYIVKANIGEEAALRKVKRAHEGDRRWHAKMKRAEARAAKEQEAQE